MCVLWKPSLLGRIFALPVVLWGSKFGVPVLASCSCSASLKLGGGDGEIARIVERAVDGRVGLGGPEVGGRGRKCVDIVAIDS